MAIIKDINDKHLLKQAIEHAKNHAIVDKFLDARKTIDILFMDLDCAFGWCRTCEGHEFWRNLNNEIDSTNEYKNR